MVWSEMTLLICCC